MQNTTQTVYLISSEGKPCVECDDDITSMEFDERINHYLEHRYKLLHVGPDTSHSDGNGNFWYRSVALVGKE